MLVIHVLKTCAQRELTEASQTKTHSFMILLGELLEDVFYLMQTALKVLYGSFISFVIVNISRKSDGIL
jgi:hypothetical protein